MLNHIRRHQKWLWFVISASVIISFVWYFGPSQRAARAGGGGGMGDVAVGEINGHPISASTFKNTRKEAFLQYYLQNGQWPEDSEFMRQYDPIGRETRSRLVLLDKLKEYDIQVSDPAVADWISTVFQDRKTKQFHMADYDRFIAQLETKGFSRHDFEQFARHQVGISHLVALAGAPGKMVPPQAAEQQFRQEHEKAAVKLVAFNSSNFLARVDASPEKIATYYTNRAANYRLPERIQLSYVEFPASNYTAQADQQMASLTNLNQRIDAEYQRRGASFFTDVNNNPLTPEAAKAKLREEMKHDAEMLEARKAAIEFATALEKMEVKTNSPNPAENLENLASAKNLQPKVTEPFAQGDEPKGVNVPAQFSRIAFSLTAEEPNITEPVVGETAAYVFAFKRRVPSALPPLEAIKDQVTEDYRRSEALRLTREAGQAFATAATNAVASGKSFEAVAKELGYNLTDVAQFPRDSHASIEGLPPQVDPASLRNTAFNLQPGHASGYIPGRDGGYVLFVEKFIPASDEEVKKELPEFVEELRRRQASEAFNEWFTKQSQAANLKLASDRNRTEEE